MTEEDARLVEDGEDPEDLPEWQAEILPKVREALESTDFLELPGGFEIDEYRIMERFSLEMENDEIRDELLRGIGGRGAFRMFREIIHDRGIDHDWYAYRRQALERLAAEWLEINGIAYTRGKRPPSHDTE